MQTQVRTSRMILWLGEEECHDPFAVGGKAASLSRLAQAHPVPPGFALTTSAFDGFSTVERIDDQSSPPPLPDALYREVAQAYRRLAELCHAENPAVAVRSSAVDEDGGDASFAGQHETFLNVIGLDALAEAIGQCWVSFGSPHALEYRRKQGLPIEGVSVAILVQQLVIADVAGVVFTADPVSGNRDEIVVNVSWGLGESVVGGSVTPDVYAVRKRDLDVCRRHVSQKRRMTVAVPHGTSDVAVPSFLQARPTLADDQVLELARLALSLEEVNGRPVDIEAEFSHGDLYLLQCRPVTTLDIHRPDDGPWNTPDASRQQLAAPREGTPIEPPEDFPVTWQHPDDGRLLWTLDRVHFPEPVPPLVFAIAGHSLARGLRASAAAYDLPISDVLVRRINTYRYQANVPFVLSPEEAGARHERSQQNLRAVMERLTQTWEREWLPEVQEHLRYWEGFDLEGASMPELLLHLDETLERAGRLWEIHFLLSSPMHGAISQFGKLHKELFGGRVLDGYKLLSGFENRILQASKALWHLSRVAMTLPRVRGVLEGHPTGAIQELETDPEAQGFLAELHAYLEEYGQRGEGLNLARPTWLEDPEPVIENLRSLLHQPDKDLAAELAATGEERDRLVEAARRVLQGYPVPVREEFEFLLHAAQQAVVLTEDHNYWIDARGMYQVRRVFLELGRRLAEAGALESRDDVFYLTPDEVRETAGLLPADCRALVNERRAEMDRFSQVTPPDELGTRPVDARDHGACGLEQAVDGSPVLRGHAGSAGQARGRARVVRTLHEAGKLDKGDILVAESLSSSWTPLFATAAGVVTDTGGILSHAAVVAREYRVPAVLGTDLATVAIHDGQPIEVDGDRGIVRILPAE